MDAVAVSGERPAATDLAKGTLPEVLKARSLSRQACLLYTSVSAGQAKQYYTQGLSREDYYSEGQEVIGQWQGLGAERLGLSGRVDQRSFDALADNCLLYTSSSLNSRRSSLHPSNSGRVCVGSVVDSCCTYQYVFDPANF